MKTKSLCIAVFVCLSVFLPIDILAVKVRNPYVTLSPTCSLSESRQVFFDSVMECVNRYESRNRVWCIAFLESKAYVMIAGIKKAGETKQFAASYMLFKNVSVPLDCEVALESDLSETLGVAVQDAVNSAILSARFESIYTSGLDGVRYFFITDMFFGRKYIAETWSPSDAPPALLVEIIEDLRKYCVTELESKHMEIERGIIEKTEKIINWDYDKSDEEYRKNLQSLPADRELVIIETGQDVAKTNYWVEINAHSNGYVDVESGWYPTGSNMYLTAVAANDYVFNGWTGDIVTNTNPLSVKLNQPLSLTPIFVERK